MGVDDEHLSDNEGNVEVQNIQHVEEAAEPRRGTKQGGQLLALAPPAKLQRLNEESASSAGLVTASAAEHGGAFRAPPSLAPPFGVTRVKEEVVSDTEQQIKDIKKLVEAEVGSLISPELHKKLRNLTLELAAKVESLQKTNARRNKITSEREELTAGRIPESIKTLGFAFECQLLDSMCLPEDRTFTVTVKSGTSVRETMKQLHCAHHLWMKELEQSVTDQHRLDLKKLANKTAFTDRGLAASKALSTDWKILDLDSDDEKDPRGIDNDKLTAKLHIIYNKTIDRLAKTAAEKQKKENDQRNSKYDLLSKLAGAPPSDHLDRAIDKRIELRIGGGGNVKAKAKAAAKANAKDAKDSKFEVDNSGIYTACVLGMDDGNPNRLDSFVSPKNEVSPAIGGGKATGKGKGGKGSNGKSKGKGKGQTKGKAETWEGANKTKGKGRGKGKGSTGTTKGKGKGKTKTRQTEGPHVKPYRSRGRGRGGRGGRGGRKPTNKQ